MIYFQQETDNAAVRAVLSRARALRWVKHALSPTVQAHEMTLRVVDATEARALNLQFRGKDYATNVLTFDYSYEPILAADIVLCAPVMVQEAAAQNKPLEAHVAHLVIHGVLHAQGYEHETNQRDALKMEALEVLLLASLGYPNPY